ncbi:hypothetical protein [Streptomyces heilongjiangensis]|uniref:Uncharacterized protein n=1 Tax=Streptomyces heilongjiangensis TaxID=945052 RepID=A0ABW1BJC0_9ACTN|nr:hypothetical protein [Streptomyces heilongjiangensis]MDC2952236.1 hypothetical protein [Streptomyces heilongjiangensis]
MAEKKVVPAWQRVLAARAQGRPVDPADLEEARAASRPGTVGWAARVAAQVAPKRQAAPDGPDRFRAAVLARLGYDVEDDGSGAA